MKTLVSPQGRVGYGYDKGENPSFDEFIQRLSNFGLPEEYLYDTIYELPELTKGINYDAYDKERIDRLGYPADWLRRCGLHPDNMKDLPDSAVVDLCETLKNFDESMSGSKINFSAGREDLEHDDVEERE